MLSKANVKKIPAYTLCMAPMIRYTDRHFRYFLRLLNHNMLLYTEMITASAIIHGDTQKLLCFSHEEQPVALQLGGSNRQELIRAAKIGQQFGYQEINLNIGCPSVRVQKGQIGVCLMETPEIVAQCVEAMQEAVDIPVTVKHRLGVKTRKQDPEYTYERLAHFVACVAEKGCQRFIVHARIAILQGVNPKDNRSIPPLSYETVYRLKRDFPSLHIIINGGIHTLASIRTHLNQVDGVMIGRAAYQNPYWLHQLDQDVFHATAVPVSRLSILESMLPYMEACHQQNIPLHQITRHLLGLFYGQPHARAFRRIITDFSQSPHKNNIDHFRTLIEKWMT